jgi:hypothetical protein
MSKKEKNINRITLTGRELRIASIRMLAGSCASAGQDTSLKTPHLTLLV